MSAQKTLKSQNSVVVNGALIAHIVIFVSLVVGTYDFSEWQARSFQILRTLATPVSVSVGVIALLSLILRGLVPANVRDQLVHWRHQFPLPGARAFTVIGPRDVRVDMGALQRRYGPLPSDQAEQATKFYEIYNEYRDAAGVLDAHKSYLATRDIALMTIILMPFLTAAYFAVSRALLPTVYYGAGLFAAFVIVSRAAQVYGRRLVENTLAVASHQPSASLGRTRKNTQTK